MPSPIPGPPPFATSTVAGLVSTIAQQFQGPKEFLGKIQATGNPLGLATYTTGGEPTPASHTGSIIYNTTLNRVRFSNGSSWLSIEPGVGSYVLTTGDTMTGQLNITGAGLVVDTADNTLVVDATNNRVGIGIASPTVPLDVAGAARITGQVDLGTGVANTKLLVAANHGFGFQANDFRAHLSGSGSKFAWYQTAAAGTALMTLFGGGDLAVDNNSLYVDAANHRVGILTSTPAFPLQVAGIIYSSTGGVRYPDNVTQTVAFVPSSYVARSGDSMTGGLVVDSADNTFVVDAINNRIGIGHNAPGRVLDIRSSVTADHLMRFQNTAVDGSSGMSFYSNGGVERFRVGYANPSFSGVLQNLAFLATDSSIDLIVAHGSTEYHRFAAANGNVKFDQVDNLLTIDSGNNRIGIGTGTPTAGNTVDIDQSLGSDGRLMRLRNSSTSGYSAIGFFNNSGTYMGQIGFGNSLVTTGGVNTFHIDYASSGLTFRNGTSTHHSITSAGNVTFDTADNLMFMDIANNRIGVMTNSPGAGVATFSSPMVIELGNSGDRSLQIRGAGTIRKGLQLHDTTNTRTWTWDHATSTNNNRMELWYHNGTTETRILTATTTGRLGINNVTPTVELDVTGSAQFSGGLTVDTNTLVVDATADSVGIGTTPSAGNKLEVQGKSKFNAANQHFGVDSITAFAGGGQGSATQLTGEVNFVTTVASSGDSVKLVAGLLGLRVTVFNLGAQPLNIFPATGGQIDALGTNAAFSLAAGSAKTFWGQSATQWRSI